METRPAAPPVSYMVVETASPRPLPPASGFEPRPSVLTPRLVPVTPAAEPVRKNRPCRSLRPLQAPAQMPAAERPRPRRRYGCRCVRPGNRRRRPGSRSPRAGIRPTAPRRRPSDAAVESPARRAAARAGPRSSRFSGSRRWWDSRRVRSRHDRRDACPTRRLSRRRASEPVGGRRAGRGAALAAAAGLVQSGLRRLPGSAGRSGPLAVRSQADARRSALLGCCAWRPRRPSPSAPGWVGPGERGC